MLKKKKKEENDKHENRLEAGTPGSGSQGASTETPEEAIERDSAEEVFFMKGEGSAAGASTEEIPYEGTSPEVTPAEEKLKKEIADLNDKYLRLYAEFDNFKRRSVKERAELIGTASRGVILSLLPVLDDFDRAKKSMETVAEVSAVKEGVDLISAKFRNILTQQGVKEMEAVGQPFDADLHEAVTNIPAPSEDLKGKVIDQLEKGYYLNDKVIRFAKVLVGA